VDVVFAQHPPGSQGTDNGRRRKGDDIAERLLDAVQGARQLLPSVVTRIVQAGCTAGRMAYTRRMPRHETERI
jgi:hypothetical protein